MAELISLLSIIGSGILSLIVPVISFLFGLGEAMLSRIFLLCVIAFFLNKAVMKIVHSAILSFIISFLVALIGLKAVPDSFIAAAMTQWYAFGILGIFILFTVFFRTVWWQRKLIMLVLIILSVAFWYFYGREKNFIILAAILLILLILDSPIHRWLAPLRKAGEKKNELNLELKLKKKELTDAAKAGATAKEIASIEREIKEIIDDLSKL